MKYRQFETLRTAEEIILEALKKEGLSHNQISKLIKRDKSTTTYYLNKLVKENKIIRKKYGRNVFYGLVKRGWDV